MQELASEKRFSWRKVRKAIALAALLGAESQLYWAVFQSLEADWADPRFLGAGVKRIEICEAPH